LPGKKRRNHLKSISIIGGATTLALTIGCVIFVFMESHSFLGVGLAAVLVLLGSIFSVVGFIPFGIGPALYYFLVWPWLLHNTVSHYPNIHMPVTLFVINTYTLILSIAFSVIASIFLFAILGLKFMVMMKIKMKSRLKMVTYNNLSPNHLGKLSGDYCRLIYNTIFYHFLTCFPDRPTKP